MGTSLGGARISVLIGTIYDAALDGARWPAALGEIANALESTTSMLQVQDLRAGTTSCVSAIGFSWVRRWLWKIHR